MSALPGQSHQLAIGVGLDVGRSRQGKPNEDSVGTWSLFCDDPARLAVKGLLFVLADGMGGAAGGAVASKAAVDIIGQSYYSDDDPDITPCIERAIEAANAYIYELGQTDPTLSGLGTTLVLAVVRADSLVVANVGDSRAYLLRKGELFPLTLDHTIVQEQIREGLLPEESAANHPQRHALSRNLGSQPWTQPDCYSNTLLEGDALLLCSDGLWGVVRHEDLEWILENYTEQIAIQSLIDLANTYGGPDNISAIVIHYGGAYSKAYGEADNEPYVSIAENITEPLQGALLYSPQVVALESPPTPSMYAAPVPMPMVTSPLLRATRQVQSLQIKPVWMIGGLVIFILLLLGAFIVYTRLTSNNSMLAVSIPPPASARTPQTTPGATQDSIDKGLLTNISAMLGNSHKKSSVAISPDGEILALASDDNTIKLWSIRDSVALHTLSGHSATINDLAFSPDGQMLASASDDNSVKLWSVKDGVEPLTLSRHTGGVWGVTFSPDGQTVVSISNDNSVKWWSVNDGTEVNPPPSALNDTKNP